MAAWAIVVVVVWAVVAPNWAGAVYWVMEPRLVVV